MNFGKVTVSDAGCNEILRKQLQNVFRVLAEPEHRLRACAIELREVISTKWRNQAEHDRWISISHPEACIFTHPDYPVGMLSFLGYRVGESEPTPKNVRWCILEYVVECHLPPL